MRKLLIVTTILMAIAGSVFAASAGFSTNSKIWGELAHNLRVINIYDLNEEELNEILRGDYPDVVIEFAPHTLLPLNFVLKGDVVDSDNNDSDSVRAEIQQTFYLRSEQKNWVFSTDLVDWKPFFEFITGDLSVSLVIKDGKPSVHIDLQMSKRS